MDPTEGIIFRDRVRRGYERRWLLRITGICADYDSVVVGDHTVATRVVDEDILVHVVEERVEVVEVPVAPDVSLFADVDLVAAEAVRPPHVDTVRFLVASYREIEDTERALQVLKNRVIISRLIDDIPAVGAVFALAKQGVEVIVNLI